MISPTADWSLKGELMVEYDLEYLLLFGPPENKLELIDGKTPCAFPFLDRQSADFHFQRWAATLSKWQRLADPPARIVDGTLVKDFGGFTLTQHRLPIRLEVPSEIDAYNWAHACFWNKTLWPQQPSGFEFGFDWAQDHSWIKMNLWQIFRQAQESLGFEGHGIGGVDISLTENDAVQPDYFFFPEPRKDSLIAGQYFKGTPALIMEVLSPFSRAIDRGPRKEIYRRAGVRQLWLIEPITLTIELYQLERGEYHLTATVSPGEVLPVPDMDGFSIAADDVFRLQDRSRRYDNDDEDEPVNDWAVPREAAVGLQHLILLGHAERRREIWNNQSPCFLAFGSDEEAKFRLERFMLEASWWEGTAVPSMAVIEPNVDSVDIGRFHFLRDGRIIRLNVDVSGLLYRSILETTANRDAWDWGE
jgi:Uma2 family endonuclease